MDWACIPGPTLYTRTVTETRTPNIAVETDTRLAELYGEAQEIRQGIAQNAGTILQYAGAKRARRRGAYDPAGAYNMTLAEAEATIAAEGFEPDSGYRWWGRPGGDVDRARENLARRQAELAANADEQAKLNAVWHANGCWNRFFMVPGGHIHSTMSCSTCNNGAEPTMFGWLPQLSGLTEADAVAAHGALLCTICFPSAPVEWTNHYETEAAAKKAAQCPGSGTWDYDRDTARLGYYTGNYGQCSHCGQRVTVTKTNKLRAHKPEAK